jgi:hypothetical protein
VGRLLYRFGEMGADPLADEVIGDGNLQAVMLQIQACGIVKPDVKTLLSYPLRDCICKSHKLGIVCADTAH